MKCVTRYKERRIKRVGSARGSRYDGVYILSTQSTREPDVVKGIRASISAIVLGCKEGRGG